MRIKYWIAIIGLIVITLKSEACRFTIREIGYSQLNLGYFILHLETDTLQNRKLVNEFTNLAYAYSIDANIKYRVSHSQGQKPVLRCLTSEGEVIAQQNIVSSSGIQTFIRDLLFSPMRQAMEKQMGNAFAFVVCFYDKEKGRLNNEVEKALVQFRKIAPHLDKDVSEEILQLVVSDPERYQEKWLLKSMGLSAEAKEPVVVVLYGRGRLAGEPLVGELITADRLFRQLVTLGTDCECGIDLSPLLKNAIPYNWDDKMRQDVSDMLGFDVDNPMILSEMGRILAKETANDGTADLSFAPQTIDLDSEFGPHKRSGKETVEEPSQRIGYRYLIIIMGLFVCLIIGIGLFILMRK